jgi:hypothetical protein
MLKIIGYGQIVIMAVTTKELLFLDLEHGNKYLKYSARCETYGNRRVAKG